MAYVNNTIVKKFELNKIMNAHNFYIQFIILGKCQPCRIKLNKIKSFKNK